jgi:hypothetical protein
LFFYSFKKNNLFLYTPLVKVKRITKVFIARIDSFSKV